MNKRVRGFWEWCKNCLGSIIGCDEIKGSKNLRQLRRDQPKKQRMVISEEEEERLFEVAACLFILSSISMQAS
jgi:hypothetical protein